MLTAFRFVSFHKQFAIPFGNYEKTSFGFGSALRDDSLLDGCLSDRLATLRNIVVVSKSSLLDPIT